MPISRKDFYNKNFQMRNTSSEEHPVLTFLRKHSNQAFTAKEISEATKRNIWGVRNQLSKLKKAKKIDHRAPCYIFIKLKGGKNGRNNNNRTSN